MSKTVNFAQLVRNLRAATVALPVWTSDNAAVYEAAQAALDKARDALRDAIIAADWGQFGAAFVTNRATEIGGRTRVLTLLVNRRPIATVSDGWLRFVDPAKAEAEYMESKQRARAYDPAYKAERELLIDRLVATGHNEASSFAEWTFEYGQMGGFFYRPSLGDGRIQVAAESALSAASKLRPLNEIIINDLEDDDFDGRRPVRARHM